MADEPDIVQKLSVDFNVVNDITVDFEAVPKSVVTQVNGDASINAEFNSNTPVNAQFNSNIQPLDAQFGTVYVVGGDCRVLYASTATWDSQPQLVSARGYIYIYADYRQNQQGQRYQGLSGASG